MTKDPFYFTPSNSSDAPPGSVLKVQEHVNLSTFTVPPQVAMSRIVYQSESFNGTATPTSAFVLWPYMPRQFSMTGDKVPVLGWAHGTNGWCPECAPSHYRTLSYNFAGPFELALQGYAVVAPDYAGLGVGKFADGSQIPVQYMSHGAAANDLAYAVVAAQQAWPVLSENFVAIGHSQGGGTAWNFAQRQAEKPINGYLGTVAASPVAGLLDNSVYQPSPWGRIATTAINADSIFPAFNLSDWVTDIGIERINLLQEIQGCQPAAGQILGGREMIKPDWNTTWSAQQWNKLSRNGGLPFAGPMLVLQGTDDGNVPSPLTDKRVNETCAMFPQNSLQYYTFNGTEHTPNMYASRGIYQDWIADRFRGVVEPEGCQKTAVTSLRPNSDYQQSPTWFLEYALWQYELS